MTVVDASATAAVVAQGLPGHGQTVCVTGAAGYIASWLVKLLLERGYTVKGTVRNPDDPKNAHLKALDGAAERLVLCKADLLDYDAICAAVDGCHGVFHTASPVTDDPVRPLPLFITDEPYIMSNKTIDEARKLFMHVHTVPTLAKYLARFALVLSKTTTLLDADDLSNVEVIPMEDVPCKDRNGNIVLSHGEPLIHTDGTGLISEDLANKCPTSVFKGNFSRTLDLQIRMYYNGLAVKGTLLVDRTLLPGTIKIRRSMIKTTSDPNLLDGQSFNSLEIVATSENGPISGEVLVYKHPGLHFGDIHVLTATPIPNLEKIVGFSKYVIIFPISGPRSLADEIANSDFDGDMYFVSRNPQLLEHFKPSEAWVPRNPPKKSEQKKPQDYDGPQLESLLFDEFFKTRFRPSYTMSTAAECWLVYMDQLLSGQVQENEREMEIKDKTLDLVDIYYESLDAPKTGIKVDVPHELRVKEYLHYMEKGEDRSYHSTSVLGKIYDKAKELSEQSKDIPPINISPLTCFTEVAAGVTKECKELWKKLYQEYRGESSALYDKKYSKEERDTGFTELYQKYRRKLYHAAEFDESPRDQNEVFGEACAIYQIVYEYAQAQQRNKVEYEQQKNKVEYAQQKSKVPLCGFAWKVAGRALCHLHAIKRGGETVLCSQSVLRDAFKKNR